MDYLDTHELQSLSPNGKGPWRVGVDRLLRIKGGLRAFPTEEEARAMLEVYRVAAATGAGTPDGLEVVRIDGGYGVLVEYVTGVSISTHITIGSYTPREAGVEMSRLLKGLHAQSMNVGRDFHAMYRTWAHALEPMLPDDLGRKLVMLVDAIPERGCLLHGDMHIGNVVVCDGKAKLIDLEAAGYGHPVFDLAIARSKMLFNYVNEAGCLGVEPDVVHRATDEILGSLLQDYFAGASAEQLVDLGRRVTVLSEIEHCCSALGIRSTDDLARLTGPHRERLAACAERLAELLPQLDRLDF